MTGFVLRTAIRLALTAAVLLAIWLLLVKPLVEEADNNNDKAFQGGGEIVEQIRSQLEAADVSGLDIDLDSADNARRLLDCIERAGQRQRMKRCVDRFG